MRAALVIIVVLAVLSLVAILVVGRGQSRSLETYKTSPRLNPLPSPDEVAEARLWIPAAQGEAGNTAVLLSPDQYAQFRRLFDNSQRDPDPATWQKGGYAELLLRDGNRKAQALVAEQFEVRPEFEWRGLGMVPYSALKIRKEFAEFDAELRFPLGYRTVADNKACECGAILRGVKQPQDCKLFGTVCTPEHPMGSCMVSNEGACAAHYSYGRLRGVTP